MTALAALFDTAAFMPHGYCILWRPDLLALHVGSDLLIGASYFSIPLALGYFVRRRADLRLRSVFWMFVLFILACGTTHLMSIWTLWQPDYGVEGLVKAGTAAVSAVTALMLWLMMPAALAIPSTAQLEAVNGALNGQIQERQRAEAAVRELNASLEARVSARTADLARLNADLERQIAEREAVEADRRLLIAELDHRVKNNMANVLSMARATLKPERPVADSLAAFEQRMTAFMNAHDLLARAGWRGVSLRGIVKAILRPYADPARDNLLIGGPDVELKAEAALPLGMVLNEMATNASKYGALAAAGGIVRVDWRAAGGGLEIDWREEGGPPAPAEPRSGFGTRLIEGGVQHQLGGVARRSIEGGRYRWQLSLPDIAVRREARS